MPELPEVETVRRGLEATVLDKVITSVEVSGKRSIRRQGKDEFVALLMNRRLVRAGRRGKYLLVGLDSDEVLVIHLRMSGQLRYELDAMAPLAPHTHVRVGFSDASELRFIDPRTFGEMFVTDDCDDDGRPNCLAGLGLDPVLDGVTTTTLAPLVRKRRTMLKNFLLDQRFVCGIGNIYADEICFLARLRPDRRTETLSGREIGRLARAITSVIGEAVEAKGSTLRDARYIDVMGEFGRFQERHAVYDRTGKACLRCGRPVERIVLAGRSAHFCARCQS
jgi:formamidopyrimidine-DNA glycosylase